MNSLWPVLTDLDRRTRRLEKPAGAKAGTADPHSFGRDPVGYVRRILGVELTPQQREIALALLEPPYLVKVDSGHNVGKTFLAACLVNWWYDSFDPGVVISTAPTQRDVVDLLWTEVRLQRQRAAVPLPLDFIGDRAPEMRSSEEHWAKGYTARKGESFQGRHRKRMLFVFDEDEGVDPAYWTTAMTMFKPEPGNAFLAIGNPTTTTSQAYLESRATRPDGSRKWRLFRLSSIDHPNIDAAARGDPLPVPQAVTAEQIDQWVADWCEPVPVADRQATDFEWRPGSGNWFRPGPVGEPRILGRRPSQGTYGVWSEALWESAVRPVAAAAPQPGVLPEVGCDVARFGDDFTAIHTRWGSASLGHESHNGWSVPQTAARLKEVAADLAERYNATLDPNAERRTPQEILIKVDDDGVGGGVVDLLAAAGYAAVPVNGASSPARPSDYPNRRSELWFATADRARRGQLCLSGLPRAALARLEVQCLAPVYAVDEKGRRVVERKKDTKEKIGRSPDDADAMNLAYLEGVAFVPPRVAAAEPKPTLSARAAAPESAQRRRGLFGR